jgi:hypothetical protein
MINTTVEPRFLNATLQFLLTMTVESTFTIPYFGLALSVSNVAFHFELPCLARKSCISFAASFYFPYALSLPISYIVLMSITSKSILFPNSNFTLVIASLWPMHVRQAAIKSLTGFTLNDANNMRFSSIVLNWKLGAALVVFENDTTRLGPNNYNNDDNTFLEFRSTSGFDISQGSSRA